MPSRLLVFLFFFQQNETAGAWWWSGVEMKSTWCGLRHTVVASSIHPQLLFTTTLNTREKKKSNCNFLRNGSNDAEHVPFFSDVATTVLHTTREVAFRITFPFNWAVFILKPQTSSSFLKYSSFWTIQSVDVLRFGTTNFWGSFLAKNTPDKFH